MLSYMHHLSKAFKGHKQSAYGMTDLSGYFLGSGFNASTGEVPFPQFLGFGGTIGL